MHKEVLNPQQLEVLPLVQKFKREFYLAGGTAIALYIGHRRSDIKATSNLDGFVRIPGLIDLAAMKAYALGRRSKWKDYVDMYYLLKDYFTISQISDHASHIFGELYSEKLFRAQLCYFDDIDYSEPVEFMRDDIPSAEIKAYLTEASINLGQGRING